MRTERIAMQRAPRLSPIRPALAQSRFVRRWIRLTSATFEGVRVSSLTAMLISDSPQQFMDQMSALDVLAVSNRAAMDKLASRRIPHRAGTACRHRCRDTCGRRGTRRHSDSW